VKKKQSHHRGEQGNTRKKGGCLDVERETSGKRVVCGGGGLVVGVCLGGGVWVGGGGVGCVFGGGGGGLGFVLKGCVWGRGGRGVFPP